MSDHERLAALRRITVKRGATKAEAATAKRLADELEAKFGKKPRARRRYGHAAALPEPPAARWRRQWVLWLELALHKIEVAGLWVHGVWALSLICLVLVSVFGTSISCGLWGSWPRGSPWRLSPGFSRLRHGG